VNRTGPSDSAEFGALVAAIGTVCAVAAVAALVPGVEHVLGAALLAAVVMALGVWVVRRELRIRRRLADRPDRPDRPGRSVSNPCTPSSSVCSAARAASRTGGAS